MLSPKLLELLRVWWRVARPNGWLFPGQRAGYPLTKTAVEDACRQAHPLHHPRHGVEHL